MRSLCPAVPCLCVGCAGQSGSDPRGARADERTPATLERRRREAPVYNYRRARKRHTARAGLARRQGLPHADGAPCGLLCLRHRRVVVPRPETPLHPRRRRRRPWVAAAALRAVGGDAAAARIFVDECPGLLCTPGPDDDAVAPFRPRPDVVPPAPRRKPPRRRGLSLPPQAM